MQIHIVQKGDTLWKISRSYDVSFDELKKLNAHLANPEYIVPGMKIFIPETKKMESMRHPYSEERPVKKEMVKKEEVKIQQHPGTNINLTYQPVHPTHMAHPTHMVHPTHMAHPTHMVHPTHMTHSVHKAQPAHPVHKEQMVHPVHKEQMVHPVHKEQMVHPTHKAQPAHHAHHIHKAQPIHQTQALSVPLNIMPITEVDMTPSPQGWRLIESTSININIHNEDHEKTTIQTAPAAVPPPPPPVQPIPQFVSPVMEEPSPMYPYEQYQPMDLCQCMPPQMYPMMPEQMHPWGGYPCVICYVPVHPCHPHPHPPHPFHHF